MMTNMFGMKKRFIVFLGTMLLIGCAADSVSPLNPSKFIPDKSTGIFVGKMDEEAVHKVLGTPHLANAYWGFELFIAEIEQTDVLYAVTPWPVPIAHLTDKLQRYTLVTYDSHHKVSDIATGIFRRPASWRKVSPIQHNFMALHLRAAELMFFVDPEGDRQVNLLATPHRRDSYLSAASEERSCLVVFGCGNDGCPDQVSVDAKPVSKLPLRQSLAYWFQEGERDRWLKDIEPTDETTKKPWVESLIAIQLTEGEHQFNLSSKYLGGQEVVSLNCPQVGTIFVTIHASSSESFWRPELINWRFDITNTLPEHFKRRPLLIMDDGQWYVSLKIDRY
ncbi:hypothetical protein JYB87_12890 [Shewanella avicenniae]|uniref:Group 4 capsule polysaccharide lipoprotein gfcB, YjbF n=1 Tax=Shewanella avicenniae TaxID=2814294 RepID=A0ABX7QMG5_9GAMM|nr:hypothetical protein [Shewanella avicenniae]QSX32643.1 hypothetical protein JYB87_12890 [Shewanella avicenniae]